VTTPIGTTLDNKRLVKISKYLSKHLRHRPERLGLALRPGGWVSVSALLTACERVSFPISRQELEEVVTRNDKQRFSFDDAGQMIRANQGHSVRVDLQLAPAMPPPSLFHGTNVHAVDQIWREGLLPMGRHHVHLSTNVPTATRVGARRGKPVVLIVEAARMASDGYNFFETDNGVWLVAAVPSTYLSYAVPS
jgi:putative RNA 2'-phosphotransferase